MKISPCLTHPQGILGVYDLILSDESNQSYIKNCPCSAKLHNGSGWVFLFNSPKKSNKAHPSIIKHASHGSGGWIKASCSELMHFCKKNIHIYKAINMFLSLPLTIIRASRSGGWCRTYAQRTWRWVIYRSKGSKVSLFKQRKTSLLLAYNEILWHFSLQILILYF